MKEIKGDAWKLIEQKEFQGLCILTNGIVNSRGENIMGAGIAKQAKQRAPGLPKLIGNHIGQNGNIPLIIKSPKSGKYMITFPTKHDWKDKSDIDLIIRSANSVNDIAEKYDINVLLPRPGCGKGGLNWNEVKPHLENILSDRIYIVSY